MHNYPMSVSYKLYALNLVGKMSKRKICDRYHISLSTLYRWIKQYDGTKESLENKSHRPHTPHPNSHTEEEIKHIKELIKENPNIGLSELYGKLKTLYAYTRNPSGLYKFLKKNKIFEEVRIKEKYKPKKYDTPDKLGVKWQLDVKYVPSICKDTCIDREDNYYQYTILEEASRKRFIYPYRHQNAESTVDFVMRSIIFFGYIPKCIQTDNGQEFTHCKKTRKQHLLDIFCKNNRINHKLIKPGTPRHNGKVERSHRNDSERFYSYLRFNSYNDLIIKMKDYLKRSNSIPSRVLNWMSPDEYHQMLYDKKMVVFKKKR